MVPLDGAVEVAGELAAEGEGGVGRGRVGGDGQDGAEVAAGGVVVAELAAALAQVVQGGLVGGVLGGRQVPAQLADLLEDVRGLAVVALAEGGDAELVVPAGSGER